MSALFEYQKSIFEKLSADAALSTLSTGVYDNVPQDATAPYIYFGDVSAEQIPNLSKNLQRINFIIFCVAESAGKKEVLEIANAVADALHLANLSVAGYEHINTKLQNQDAQRQSNGVTYIARMEFVGVVSD